MGVQVVNEGNQLLGEGGLLPLLLTQGSEILVAIAILELFV